MTDSAALRDALAALPLELCRIPSETKHEAEIADWVQRRCTAVAGAAAVTRIGHSVVCDPYGVDRDGLPIVALVGHLDTVKCAEDQAYAIADGRVYGCGASDMKAGVAVMLALLDRWRELQGARPSWVFWSMLAGASRTRPESSRVSLMITRAA